MKHLIVFHIMFCKIQSMLCNCINYILIALISMYTLCWLIKCPDWNISIMVNVEISISYLGAMLSGCVSPHSPDTQSKYTTSVTAVICCTCASYCWYKCWCAIYSMGVSPCWYGRPYICSIETLCSHRSVSPCIHGVKCIYIFHYTGILCCRCVIYNKYSSNMLCWCASSSGCVSPRGCSTSCGYYLSRRTP